MMMLVAVTAKMNILRQRMNHLLSLVLSDLAKKDSRMRVYHIFRLSDFLDEDLTPLTDILPLLAPMALSPPYTDY